MAKTVYEVSLDFAAEAWITVTAESEEEAKDKALAALYTGEDVSYFIVDAYANDVEEEFDQDEYNDDEPDSEYDY